MKSTILNAQRRSIDPDFGALHFVQMTIGDPIYAPWMDAEPKLTCVLVVISITAFYCIYCAITRIAVAIIPFDVYFYVAIIFFLHPYSEQTMTFLDKATLREETRTHNR